MPDISINVRNKRATPEGVTTIVCGNSDYEIRFSFDSEWDSFLNKTARISYQKNGQELHQDVAFSGSSCPVPVLTGVTQIMVGVYAGDLHTTTPAIIPCETSILCYGVIIL